MTALLCGVIIKLLGRELPTLQPTWSMRSASFFSLLGDTVKMYPETMRSLFLKQTSSLMLLQLKQLYHTVWSVPGSNRRNEEEETMFVFEIFPSDCESKCLLNYLVITNSVYVVAKDSTSVIHEVCGHPGRKNSPQNYVYPNNVCRNTAPKVMPFAVYICGNCLLAYKKVVVQRKWTM